MANKQTIVKKFFEKYEEAANTFDAELLTSLYADTFMSGGPAGTATGSGDEYLRKATPKRKALFQSIGFQKASLLDVAPTWLDDHYVLAKTKWRMDFKKNGAIVEAFFDESYFLYADKGSAKAVFFISHEDETEVMRRLGLIE